MSKYDDPEYLASLEGQMDIWLSHFLMGLDKSAAAIKNYKNVVEDTDRRFIAMTQIEKDLSDFAEKVEQQLFNCGIGSRSESLLEKSEKSEEIETFDIAKFKLEVLAELVSTYGMLLDEAGYAVETSYNNEPENWHENAVVKDLAEYLASDSDDELD